MFRERRRLPRALAARERRTGVPRTGAHGGGRFLPPVRTCATENRSFSAKPYIPFHDLPVCAIPNPLETASCGTNIQLWRP